VNQVRHDLPDLGDVGGVDEPPAPPGGGGGGRGPGDMPPRRGHRQWLPWLGLGATLLAVERIALLTLAMGGFGATVYAAAAAVFVLMLVGGLVVGGRAFHRAYHAAQNRPPRR